VQKENTVSHWSLVGKRRGRTEWIGERWKGEGRTLDWEDRETAGMVRGGVRLRLNKTW